MSVDNLEEFIACDSGYQPTSSEVTCVCPEWQRCFTLGVWKVGVTCCVHLGREGSTDSVLPAGTVVLVAQRCRGNGTVCLALIHSSSRLSKPTGLTTGPTLSGLQMPACLPRAPASTAAPLASHVALLVGGTGCTSALGVSNHGDEF